MRTITLDYSLKTPEERKALVDKIVAETPTEKLTPKYLEILSDYLVLAMDKQEKHNKEILTDNRRVTLNRRETSYQGLAERLESGEDGIYNMTSDLGKQAFLVPKKEITDADIAEVPGLA